jgi:hypothetical protein
VLPLTQELQGTMESVFQGQTDMSSEKKTNFGSRDQSARGVFRFTNMHLLMLSDISVVFANPLHTAGKPY